MNEAGYGVAYLGPEGTFSFFTGQDYVHEHLGVPDAVLRPCADLADVFEAVAGGCCQLGMVPLENSLRGTVGQSFDLFLRHELVIRGEVFARISNALLSREATLGAVRVVYSHAQPLAQCAGWLRRHLPGVPVVPVESTAAAARRAAGEAGAAAIGHWRLSALFDLQMLASAIEDESGNWTRFVAVTRPETFWPPEAATGHHRAGAAIERSSLLFTLPDKPGALARILCILADHGVNMRKIESRPLHGGLPDNRESPWKYAFFVDVECDVSAPERAGVLGAVAAACTSLRLLGSYEAGPRLGIGSVKEKDHD